jgi:hypothetical protein
MKKPCRECPFNRSYEEKFPRLGVLRYLQGVMKDDAPPCHMGAEDGSTPCAGTAMFKEGGHPEVFSSVAEFGKERTA